jgi:CRISPR-associated protein Cas1
VDLVLDRRGLCLRRRRQRFLVTGGPEPREWAAEEVSQILLGPAQSISTDALALAVETHTDVAVLDWRGQLLGRFAPAAMGGAARLRRAQLEAATDHRGVVVAAGLVLAKCRNQLHLLRALDVQATAEARQAIARLLERRPAPPPSLAEARPGLFALEGRVGLRYLRGLAAIVPPELGLRRRSRRPPRDLVNAALSYGYAILRAQVERALAICGFEPGLGFLHTDRWGKPSLSLDLMEPFRPPIVDRAVLTLVRRRQLGLEHGEPQDDGAVLLGQAGRRLVAAQVMERLHDRLAYRGMQVSWRDLLVHEARGLAAFLLGQAADYRPYVHRWT